MSWQPALIGLCLGFIACCALALIASRPKRNKRHNLPPPDSRTERSPDWRRYELSTPRKYIP